MNQITIKVSNQAFFEKLLLFSEELYKVFVQYNFKQITYGSLAYLYYTKDHRITINDIDFLIPECEFETLISESNNHDTFRCETTSYHSLKILKNDMKISFDSIEHYLNNLPSKSIPAEINGVRFNILNLQSLKEAYRLGIESIPVKKEAYALKFSKLSQFDD
jgi:hypothetical protein